MQRKVFTIHVVPRSSRQAIMVQPDGTLRAKLTSAPVDGKANDELINILSDHFGTAKSNITITKGLTSRKKLVTIQSTKSQK